MAGGWGKYDGPLPTLGSSIRAPCWLVVWCKAETCRHRPHIYLSPETLAHYAASLGEGMTLLDFEKRLTCSGCGGKDIDMIVNGTGPQKMFGSYPPPLPWHRAPDDYVASPPIPARSRRSRRARSPF